MMPGYIYKECCFNINNVVSTLHHSFDIYYSFETGIGDAKASLN